MAAVLGYKSSGAVAENPQNTLDTSERRYTYSNQRSEKMESKIFITLLLVGLAVQSLAKPKGKSSKLRKYLLFIHTSCLQSDYNHMQLSFSRFAIATHRT